MDRSVKLVAYIDGACRFNPGPAGIGVWLVGEGGETVAEISEYLGHGTNNIAEWSAYLRALKEGRDRGAKVIAVFTDSQLLAQQAKGKYKIRDAKLQKLSLEAKTLERHFERVDINHVPREQNSMADRLARLSVHNKQRTF
ncbi:MAG: ribonuclease HI family protein [Elusimicrobia bacterium]|nr:ribonuclease HI family protein [Elusimicrobiota bacterium]